ncbi:fibronectin type III domain-containing protein [Tumebacillus permanentifrigoris]|uniref:Fibronectin type-III domain-containing protein n=1 Tax=Tumebacillus permanentifrigoris TaxID=378543 RepID=A0A316DAK1_9BACL|nr:hypothetical protein [Tumebacillus permanentifrigoris]PWK14309.1 hypothetical protein C7459_10563 [Tumebacillus permanentifrigoris]
MKNWKKVRSKVWQSGLTVLSALLLVSANTTLDFSTSTAYAATGPVTLSGTAGNAVVTLNWAPVTDATGYYVYRNGTKITSTPVTDTTYVDTTVINGTTFSYTVSAIIGNTTSDPSNAVNLLPKSTPGLLRGLASTSGVTNLTDGDNATFSYYGYNNTQTFVLPTPATVTGLNSYGHGYFRIKLYDTAGTLLGTYTPSASPVNAFTALNFQHVAKVVVTNTSPTYSANMYDLDLSGTPDSNTIPTGLAATTSDARVSLTWSSVPGVTQFNLYRDGVQSSNKINTSPITDTTFTDTNVINGNTYTYYLAPITASGEGLLSTVSALPKSPAGLLRGLASTTGVTNLTDGDNATFSYYGFNNNQTFVLPTPATVTGLNSYGHGYFRIKLYDTAGTLLGTYTPSGSPVNAFTALNFQHVAKVVVTNTSPTYSANMYDLDLTGTPDANAYPTGLAATASDARVSLTWSSVPGVTQFNLYKDGVQPSNKINTSPITDTTFVDTNVINGNTYTYYLAPITASGEGLLSTVSALPKSPAGLLRGLASTTGVTNLTDGDNATFSFLGFNNNQTFVLPTPATVTGLNSYGHGYFRIKLYDTAGTLLGTYTPSASPVNAFTALNFQHVAKVVVTNTSPTYSANMYDLDLTGTPDANTIPAGLAATSSDARVSLTWSSVPGVTQYNLYRDGVQSSNKINTSPITDTTFIDTNVINGNTYTYYLAPITTSGEGLLSTVSALPKSPAGLLRGLASTTGVTNLTDGDNATFSYYGYNNNQTFVLPTPATVTGLNSYGHGYFRIKLYDTAGTLLGTYTPSASPVNAFTALNFQHVAKVVVTNTSPTYSANMYDLDLRGTPDAYPPNAPVDLTGQAGDAQATLTWKTSASATGYNLFRDGVKVNTSPLTDTTFTDTGLVNGTNYVYFVTAINDAGESAPSNTVNVIPVPILVAPSDLTGTAGDAQVALTWTAPDGAVSYNVYRDGVLINTAPVTSTTFVDANLTNGTSYTYYVTAVNTGGESAASNTISLTPMASSNLLINPSFENGTASDTTGLQVGKNWTSYVPTGAVPDLAVVTSPVYSGRYAQKVAGSGIPNGSAIDVYQSVAARANTAYTVSGMYNIESLNNAFVQLYIDFYDVDGHFIKSNSVKYGVTVPSYMQLTDNDTEPGYMLMANTLTTTGYVQLTRSIITPANTASFRLYAVLRASANNASGTFYVDDLSVVQN